MTASVTPSGSLHSAAPCATAHSWSFNRDFYGWTVNQWQAWARGDMNVSDEQAQQTWAVRCANVGEYWIDDQRFHGDWYGYGERWSRVVLDPGVHRIRVRLASEVRLFGGGLPPSLTFVLEFQPVNNDVVPLQGGRIVPEAVDGRLVSAPLALGLFNGAATQAVATVAAVNDTRVWPGPDGTGDVHHRRPLIGCRWLHPSRSRARAPPR